MLRTYEEVLKFSNAARSRGGQKTKLSYAIERVAKSYASQAGRFETAYKEKLEDLDIEHCSVDERGNIIEPMVYTKDAQRARLRGQREALAALLKSEVEVDPYMATTLPEGLTDAEREAFAGFVLPESVSGEAEEGAGQVFNLRSAEAGELTVQANGGAEVVEAQVAAS